MKIMEKLITFMMSKYVAIACCAFSLTGIVSNVMLGDFLYIIISIISAIGWGFLAYIKINEK